MVFGSLMSYLHVICSPNAKIGHNVQIGPFCVIEDCIIEDNVVIESHCVIRADVCIKSGTFIGRATIVHENVEIGCHSFVGYSCELGIDTPLAKSKKLVFGDHSCIRSKSIFYIGSTFQDALQTGHAVVVRENIQAGLGLQIGTQSDLHGDNILGNYVRLHSNVNVSKYCILHSFVWLFPHVVLSNDPLPPSDDMQGVEVGEYALIAARSIVLPGVKIGEHSFVGAASTVTKDVEDYSLVLGSPARHVKDVRDIKDKNGNTKYPWKYNFHRGYPQEVVNEWIKDQVEI